MFIGFWQFNHQVFSFVELIPKLLLAFTNKENLESDGICWVIVLIHEYAPGINALADCIRQDSSSNPFAQ